MLVMYDVVHGIRLLLFFFEPVAHCRYQPNGKTLWNEGSGSSQAKSTTMMQESLRDLMVVSRREEFCNKGSCDNSTDDPKEHVEKDNDDGEGDSQRSSDDKESTSNGAWKSAHDVGCPSNT